MDDPLILFALALIGLAALAVLAAWAWTYTWPVDTGTHDFHRPLERQNRDAGARRHNRRSES
jgi:hypothetical protein